MDEWELRRTVCFVCENPSKVRRAWRIPRRALWRDRGRDFEFGLFVGGLKGSGVRSTAWDLGGARPRSSPVDWASRHSCISACNAFSRRVRAANEAKFPPFGRDVSVCVEDMEGERLRVGIRILLVMGGGIDIAICRVWGRDR